MIYETIHNTESDYLADSLITGDFDAALRHLLAVMTGTADGATDETAAEAITAAAEDANLESAPFKVIVGDYAFGIEEREPEDAVEALAAHLECDASDIQEARYTCYGAPTFEHGSAEYIVATDDEANEACTQYVQDSVWAFNASFLSDMTNIPAEMFEAVQDKCEGANDAVLAVIEGTCGLAAFVERAIGYDGRGHFLSSYDGNENESGDWFIYRIN